MFRKDCHAVENALSRSVGPGHVEANRVIVDLDRNDWLAANCQKVAIRRKDLFIEIHPKAEDYVIRTEGPAVRKT